MYDGFGRRQQKIAGGVTHTYVSDRASLIEERVSTGQTLRYVEGPAIDQHLARQDGTTVTYYVADHLGSVVQETNTSGAVALARKYDPWGNLLSGANSPGWAFTGREWDPETGLYYYRARHYDPRPGRFVSEDPIGFAGGTSLNAYVSNSPTGYRDPSGKLPAAALIPLVCPVVVAHLGLAFGGATDVDPGNQRTHCWVACSMNRYCFPLLFPSIPRWAQRNWEASGGDTGDAAQDNAAADYGVYNSYRVWRLCATICEEWKCHMPPSR